MEEGYPNPTPLNFIRTNRAFRSLFVVAALLGWVALSQRCALWQLSKSRQVAAAAQHDCCHKDSPQPGKAPDQEPRKAECCMALNVLVPDCSTNLPDSPFADSLTVPVEWISVAIQSLSASTAIVLDTGPPPDVPAFTELVLQRSLHSHAPPFSA